MCRRERNLTVLLLMFGPTSTAFAHGVESHGERGPRDWSELIRWWPFEPRMLLPLLLTLAFYLAGLHTLWKGGHAGRGVRVRDAVCFGLGWLTLAVALVSPLHPWGNVLFSAHMIQHELMMLVAAPLIVMGRPAVATLNGFPPGWGRSLARATRGGWLQATWQILTRPLIAWTVHAVVLWLWHAPALFDATLRSDLVHALQHLSFLLSALLFWWAVLHGHPGATGYGVAVLYMFTTAFHSGFLGALITLARRVWYPGYRGVTSSWGLTPLEDQQLGGLIMWVPACSVYVGVGLVLFAGWLRAAELREDRLDRKRVSDLGRLP